MKRHTHNSGQTLIEIIVAIGLVIMVLITLVSALTLGIRNNQFAKDQALAKNRVREATEWFRSLRQQMGWDSFYTMITNDGPSITYCLQYLPTTINDAESLGNQPCGFLEILPGSTSFYRNAIITIPAGTTDEVDVQVEVSWTSGGKTHSSNSTLIMKKWL
jgi:type II secretory pathway pseudopilin PulG